MRKLYNILVGKPEWKRAIGKPRHKWKDNKIGFEGIRWCAWTGFIWLKK
jgi:hypothetical protein